MNGNKDLQDVIIITKISVQGNNVRTFPFFSLDPIELHNVDWMLGSSMS